MRLVPSQEPPLTPDRESARQWLDQELAKSQYEDRLSWWERFLRWLNEHLGGTSDAGGPPTSHLGLWIIGLLLLITAVVLALSVGRWRSGARRRGSARQAGVFEESGLTSGEHRERAQRALEQGLLDVAVQEAFRALARGLQERTVVADRPGLTATEVASQAATALPDLTPRFVWAAGLFNDVTYGHRYPAAQDAHDLLDLGDATRSARPVTTAVPS